LNSEKNPLILEIEFFITFNPNLMYTTRLIPFLFCALCAVFVYSSCKKEAQVFESDTLKLPTKPFDYTTDLLFVAGGQNRLNPTTNDGATLGRVLFYDKNLSLNNTIACASCHKQENGFADVGASSEGFKGGLTTRNSLPIVNLANDNQFFWDMRTSSLEDLVLQPVANHIEMGLDNTENLLKKLNRTSYYPALFEKAFGSQEITQERVSKALAQFVRAIVSKDSKFDAVRRGSWGLMTESETNGWNLFFNKLHCTGCHGSSDLNGGVGNIGLEKDYKDNGIGAQSGDNFMNGTFKVPSLRNVALTAPYMHDGRFKTLEEVVEHYNSGVQNHTNLSTFLKGFLWSGNGGIGFSIAQNCWNCGVGTAGQDFKPLDLSTTQKQDLVNFLKMTTDETLLKNDKYANPFTK
jgi:cytochrome c peroxidase